MDTDTDPVPREGRPPMNRLERWWINIHMHALLSGVAMTVLLLSYFGAHDFARQFYEPPARALLHNAVSIYQIGEDPETDRLAVLVSGVPYTPASDTAGPLGVGKLPSVRGFLFDTSQRAKAYNRAVAARIERFSAKPSESQSGKLEIDIADLSPGADPDVYFLVRDPNPGHRFELPPNEVGLRRLRALLASPGTGFNRGQRRNAVGEFVSLARAVPSVRVKDAVARIVEASLKNREAIRLAPTEIDEAICRRAVAEYLESFDRLRTTLGTDFPGTASSHRFKTDLASIVNQEIGYLWIFGSWRWLEILFLTWLGVMTEHLVRLGQYYVKRHPNRAAIWDPRESLRTFLKLTYAPVVSMVVIAAILFSDVMDFQFDVGDGAYSIVVLAFIFGYFPHLALSLLKKLATSVLQTTTVARQPPEAQPGISRVDSPPEVPDGSPPSFAATRVAIVRHATAPLRQ